MKLLGQLKKYTTAKFYGDDSNNPTMIYTGNRSRQDFVEIEGNAPVIELSFKLPNGFDYPRHGISINVLDIDTDCFYYIYNDSVFELFKGIAENTIKIKNSIITARFILTKTGSLTSLKLITNEFDRSNIKGF